MAQSKEGSKKAKATLLAKDPDYFKKLGALGGKAKVKKGFAKMSPERLREVSSTGGINKGKNHERNKDR